MTGTDQEWKFVHGLYEFAIYGGRVDNPFDVRVMVSYLKQFFDGNTLSQGRNRQLGPLKLPSSTNFRVRYDYIALCICSSFVKKLIEGMLGNLVKIMFFICRTISCTCIMNETKSLWKIIDCMNLSFSGLCGCY